MQQEGNRERLRSVKVNGGGGEGGGTSAGNTMYPWCLAVG